MSLLSLRVVLVATEEKKKLIRGRALHKERKLRGWKTFGNQLCKTFESKTKLKHLKEKTKLKAVVDYI